MNESSILYYNVSNNYVELTWPEFQPTFRQKYKALETRATLPLMKIFYASSSSIQKGAGCCFKYTKKSDLTPPWRCK